MLFMVRQDTKSVMLLADILETIEVTADELLDQRFAPLELETTDADGDTLVQHRLTALRAFVRQVRDLELTLLTKLEQARVRARTVARSDWRLRPIMSLFTAGTQALADHIASPQGREAMRFDGGAEVFPFLRSRELLAPMAEHYDGTAELLVTDSFRLLGLIKLRDLMERCEVALNALDAHYDLYQWPSEETSDQEEIVTELQVVAKPAAAVVVPFEREENSASAPAAAVMTTLPAHTDASAASGAMNWGEVVQVTVAPAETAAPVAAEPSKEAIAVAEAEAEDSLKSLSERLAELRTVDSGAADIAPPDAAKSDAA